MRPSAPADLTQRRSGAPLQVAVVSQDELLVRRIRGALSTDAVVMMDHAAVVGQLSDAATEAGTIVLAGRHGAAAQRSIIRAAGARFPDVPRVLVGSGTTNAVRKALDAGASAVLLETEIELALPEVVRAVCARQVVVPNGFRHAIRPALSHREKETLALVAGGLTNREIAARLFLAESTVKSHVASIFGKLGVGSRSEAAAIVLDPDEKLGLSIISLAAGRTGPG